MGNQISNSEPLPILSSTIRIAPALGPVRTSALVPNGTPPGKPALSIAAAPTCVGSPFAMLLFRQKPVESTVIPDDLADPGIIVDMVVVTAGLLLEVVDVVIFGIVVGSDLEVVDVVEGSLCFSKMVIVVLGLVISADNDEALFASRNDEA